MEGDGFTFAEQRDYLVAKEEKLRNAVLASNEAGARRSIMKKAVEDWWSCVAELFELYQTQAEQQRILEPMPPDFLGAMARMSRVVAKGRLPDVFRFANRRNASYWCDANIAAAIVYVEAVRSGKMIDDDPIAMVVLAFGISEELVRRWVREKKRYLSGYAAETEPDRIERAMTQAGSRYRLGHEPEAIAT